MIHYSKDFWKGNNTMYNFSVSPQEITLTEYNFVNDEDENPEIKDYLFFISDIEDMERAFRNEGIHTIKYCLENDMHEEAFDILYSLKDSIAIKAA